MVSSGHGPLPTKETEERRPGEEGQGFHGVHSFILVNVRSVCGISQVPATVCFLQNKEERRTQAASLLLKVLHSQALSKDLVVEQGGATLF